MPLVSYRVKNSSVVILFCLTSPLSLQQFQHTISNWILTHSILVPVGPHYPLFRQWIKDSPSKSEHSLSSKSHIDEGVSVMESTGELQVLWPLSGDPSHFSGDPCDLEWCTSTVIRDLVDIQKLGILIKDLVIFISILLMFDYLAWATSSICIYLTSI